MRDNGLNRRLLSAAEFVRQGAVFADIGTDHAYLPLFLLSSGRIKSAVLADINEGPLASARRNAARTPFMDRLAFVLTDGAAELDGMGVTDYAICGMGGELIAEIIERAPHLKNSEINLILQPMSRQSSLRTYLARAGFDIISESYSFDGGKCYVCFLARFDGVCREITPAEAEFGSEYTEIVNKDLQKRYILVKKSSLLRTVKGKELGGENTENERRLLEYADRLLDS